MSPVAVAFDVTVVILGIDVTDVNGAASVLGGTGIEKNIIIFVTINHLRWFNSGTTNL